MTGIGPDTRPIPVVSGRWSITVRSDLTSPARLQSQAARMDWMSQAIALGNAGIAMVLGGLIGYERELKDRPAGFRTHMLVAGAAALLLGVGRLVLDSDTFSASGEILRIDPLRLIEAVVAGVAFIGAGTIFARRSDGAVAGITTAASLLMVAVIGVVCGLGFHLLGIAATLLTLVVLTILRALEH